MGLLRFIIRLIHVVFFLVCNRCIKKKKASKEQYRRQVSMCNPSLDPNSTTKTGRAQLSPLSTKCMYPSIFYHKCCLPQLLKPATRIGSYYYPSFSYLCSSANLSLRELHLKVRLSPSPNCPLSVQGSTHNKADEEKNHGASKDEDCGGGCACVRHRRRMYLLRIVQTCDYWSSSSSVKI